MTDTYYPPRRTLTKWSDEQLERLLELGQEKRRQKLARQEDPANKVSLSWKVIGEQLGSRDAASAQARYNALLKQRQQQRDAQDAEAASSSQLSEATEESSEAINSQESCITATKHSGITSPQASFFSRASTLEEIGVAPTGTSHSNFVDHICAHSSYPETAPKDSSRNIPIDPNLDKTSPGVQTPVTLRGTATASRTGPGIVIFRLNSAKSATRRDETEQQSPKTASMPAVLESRDGEHSHLRRPQASRKSLPGRQCSPPGERRENMGPRAPETPMVTEANSDPEPIGQRPDPLPSLQQLRKRRETELKRLNAAEREQKENSAKISELEAMKRELAEIISMKRKREEMESQVQGVASKRRHLEQELAEMNATMWE